MIDAMYTNSRLIGEVMVSVKTDELTVANKLKNGVYHCRTCDENGKLAVSPRRMAHQLGSSTLRLVRQVEYENKSKFIPFDGQQMSIPLDEPTTKHYARPNDEA